MPGSSPSRTSPVAEASPESVVRDFLRALEALDIDAAVSMVADDIVYVNKGLPAVRGREQFETTMRLLDRYCDAFEARMTNLASDGDIVLTERVDMLGRGDFRPEFWVCGTFQVRDGRIVLWRDHFDYVAVTVAVVRSLVSVVARRLAGR